ncbi:MAG: hypothetical protein ACC608_03035 [Anaerofustis sp.]
MRETILDRVRNVFQGSQIGKVYTSQEIIRMVLKEYPSIKEGSIKPSDYCNNMTNKDKESNPALNNFNIFENVARGKYKFIGENNCEISNIQQKRSSYSFNEIDATINSRSIKPIASHIDLIEHNCCKNNKNKSNIQLRFDSDFTKLWCCNNHEEWLCAEEGYWDIIKFKKNLDIEIYFENLESEKIKQMSITKFINFLDEKYFVWKFTGNYINQKQKIFRQQDIDELVQIHKDIFAFNKNDIKQGLLIAKKINGLGVAGASGLLSVLFPEYFGTVDKFIVKSLLTIDGFEKSEELSRIKDPSSLTVNEGLALMQIMREKAMLLNKINNTTYWTPRKIDKVLWSHRQ